MKAAHADASPSSASIWLKCPASVTLARGKQRRPSVYTSEGSAAHHVAELLVHGLLPPDKVTVDGIDVEVDDDMVSTIDRYVTYATQLKAASDVFLTEEKLKLTFRAVNIREPLYGTADIVAYQRQSKILEIVDLKYGKGVAVPVVGNPQLRIYGLGALQKLTEPVDTVRLTIVQPRLAGKDHEDLAVDELIAWRDTILLPALMKIAADVKTEIPGEHCRWCVRAGECQALADMAQSKAVMAFNPKTNVPDASGLDNTQLAKILDVAELIVAWVGQVRAEASQRLEHGGDVPGWKLVAKRSPRRWLDEEQAREAYQGNWPALLPEMLRLDTPAAVERVLKKAGIDPDVGLKPLITNQSSGTTLVREDDSRPAAVIGAKSVFQQLQESLAMD